MKIASLFVAVAVVATTAIAQAPSDAPSGRRDVDNDPDRVVCIRERQPGSLIVLRRICRTRQEWAEHRQQSRDVVEKIQLLKSTGGH